jgi:hypothetical protein
MKMVVIWDLSHLVIEYPFREFASEFLLSDKIKGFFHIGHFFWRYFNAMFTQDGYWYITRITIKNRKPQRIVKFRIPLCVSSKFTEVTTPLGH